MTAPAGAGITSTVTAMNREMLAPAAAAAWCLCAIFFGAAAASAETGPRHYSEFSESSVSFDPAAELAPPDIADDYRIDRNKTGPRPRAGVKWRENFAYVSGGGVWAQSKTRLLTRNGINAFANSGRNAVWGRRYGAGYERAVAPNFALGANYMYANMRNRDLFVPLMNERWRSHSFSLTASYRF